jgi:hypothetical protein
MKEFKKKKFQSRKQLDSFQCTWLHCSLSNCGASPVWYTVRSFTGCFRKFFLCVFEMENASFGSVPVFYEFRFIYTRTNRISGCNYRTDRYDCLFHNFRLKEFFLTRSVVVKCSVRFINSTKCRLQCSDLDLKKIRGLSPRENYTDRATASCWPS